MTNDNTDEMITISPLSSRGINRLLDNMLRSDYNFTRLDQDVKTIKNLLSKAKENAYKNPCLKKHNHTGRIIKMSDEEIIMKKDDYHGTIGVIATLNRMTDKMGVDGLAIQGGLMNITELLEKVEPYKEDN